MSWTPGQGVKDETAKPPDEPILTRLKLHLTPIKCLKECLQMSSLDQKKNSFHSSENSFSFSPSELRIRCSLRADSNESARRLALLWLRTLIEGAHRPK